MRRCPRNPILTRKDIPDLPADGIVDVTSVFNPGALRLGERIRLLLRVQTRGRRTVWMWADSVDGERFDVRAEIVRIEGLETLGETVYHVYDPRLTRLGEDVYVVFAADVDGACRLGVARLRDDGHFDLVSFDRRGDRRNGVLFPARVGGRYVRLERPNAAVLDGGVTSGHEIVLAASDDLSTWQEVGPVMGGNLHFWDERIGSGPPPVRVAEGWLHLYHGIATHFASASVYQVGAVLLAADDPTRVLARTRDNILEPREPYEQVGQVPNVVFPGGMVVEGVQGDEVAAPEAEVRVYYGAADTCVGLATTTVASLMDALTE